MPTATPPIAPTLATLLFLVAPLAHAASGNAPTAHDDAYTTTQGDNLSVDAPGVLDDDTDPENDGLTAVLVSSAGAAGTLYLYSDGSLEYETAPGFVGTDTFTYVANDGTSDSAPATITFTVTSGTGGGSAFSTNDEAAYLAAIANAGWTYEQESFEGAMWPRTPSNALSVSNLGVTWTASHAANDITTSNGAALFGQWGVYQIPHGNYTSGSGCLTPGVCTDGWIVTADDGVMRAAGLWIRCNAGTAGIEFVLDGTPVDFPNSSLPAGNVRFFGVVEPAGFTTLHVHETEGTSEDASFIFGDRFRFVLDGVPSVTTYGCGGNPAGSLTVLAGAPKLGTSMTFGIDNPLGTQTPGSTIALLAFANQPAVGFPCGQLVPGWGMSGPGADGEILLDLLPPNPILLIFGTPWGGAGSPSNVPLSLPPNPSLAGITAYAQGMLVDLSPGASVFVGVTEGLAVELGL